MASTKIAPLNPKPFVEQLVGKEVVIKLKWGHEYHGWLESKDDYMNFKLTECEEWGYEDSDGQRVLKMKGKLGSVLIRCNNVLYIRHNDAADQDNEEGQMADQ